MSNYFATNLEYIRKKRGLSPSELAAKINVNQSTISRWESGQMGINVDKAYDLSIILDIPLPDLIGKDLRSEQCQNNNFKKMSPNEEITLLKDVLKNKGVLDENDKMSEEDFNRLIDFAKRNKDFIMKDNK